MPDYSKLHRLTNIGRSLVNEDFRTNPDAEPITAPGAAEEVQPAVSLAAFNNAVDDSMAKYTKPPEAGDVELAEALHKSLKISRRLAMDMSIWYFLSGMARPEYVRYRWANSGGRVTQERFLGSIKRNAFARLWWCAEIVQSNGDYSRVEYCFGPGRQDLYETMFGRRFSKYPPAARVFIDAARLLDRDPMRQLAKDLNLMLSTFVVEDLPEAQLSGILTQRLSLSNSK